MLQNDKKFCLLLFMSQEPYIRWLSFMVHICIVKWYLHVCCSFSKVLIFWVHRGVTGQKMVQNDKNFSLLCLIFQESYIIWLSFMVQMCKIISPGVFFNFPGCQRAERAKNGPKWQKVLPVPLCISRTVHHINVIFGTHV